MRASSLTACALLVACTVEPREIDAEADSESEAEEDDFRIAPLPGYGQYCSVDLDLGGWAFRWGTASPCADIFALDGTGTILHAGRYDEAGLNNVVMSCDGVTWWGRVGGGTALQMAKDYAIEHNLGNCSANVAPAVLPIFSSPFSVNPLPAGYHTGRPYDFAYDMTLDVGEYGQPSTQADYVDYLGIDRTAQQGDVDHGGWDYSVPEDSPLFAVADGVVVAARFRDVSDCDCPDDEQGEVLIEHVVRSSSRDLYAERFVSYYAHLRGLHVVTGEKVSAGELIGVSGDTGCSWGPHLHFGTFRLSNTNTEWQHALEPELPPESCAVCSSDADIDPYGWWPAAIGFDPVALLPDRGAMSIWLWKPGQAPPYTP